MLERTLIVVCCLARMFVMVGLQLVRVANDNNIIITDEKLRDALSNTRTDGQKTWGRSRKDIIL